ncbi:MAG: hypothetical protein IKN49_03595 [Elusimicrobiaceae bacterium]|nr:hypothetical protein [Elusimicrobiaceae bacterium]
MTAVVAGFLLACVWGICCYHAGKKAAEYKHLKKQEGESVYVDEVVSAHSGLGRDELLERLQNNTHK